MMSVTFTDILAFRCSFLSVWKGMEIVLFVLSIILVNLKWTDRREQPLKNGKLGKNIKANKEQQPSNF